MSCEGRAVWHMHVPGVSFAFVFSLKVWSASSVNTGEGGTPAFCLQGKNGGKECES